MSSSMLRPEETAADAFQRHLATPTAGLFLLGLTLALVGRFALDGVWAGMAGFWGLSLVGLAVLVRVAILLVRVT